jgi:hypothetical protein
MRVTSHREDGKHYLDAVLDGNCRRVVFLVSRDTW